MSHSVQPRCCYIRHQPCAAELPLTNATPNYCNARSHLLSISHSARAAAVLLIAVMDALSLSLAQSSFQLHPTYLTAASDQCATRRSLLHSLLTHKRLPLDGWSEHHIVALVQQLAALDSNNNTGRAMPRKGHCPAALERPTGSEVDRQQQQQRACRGSLLRL